MESVWKELKSAIQKRVPDHSYRMWIEPLVFRKEKENQVVLSCPNNYSKKRVKDYYGAIIASEIENISGTVNRLLFEVSGKNGNSKSKPENKIQLKLPNENLRPHSGRLLRRDFTFDQFVVGGNNDFAYSASLSLASRKSSHQNSLFLLSETGMGKSHLSQAIGHHILSEFPLERVYYITSEDFTNEMIQAIRSNTINKFKERYRRQCDVLLLEDIHFLNGKERTQAELALTLDCLLDADKKLIFTSCYLPSDIPKMSDSLRSRLSCGLISNIEPPDFRTRVRILQKKAGHNGYQLPDDVTQFLAGELSVNVRQLESGLIGVTAKSALMGAPIDLNLAQSVVKNIAKQSKNITINVVKKLVCKHYSIPPKDLVSRSRKHSIVRPRQIAIYLSRRYTDSPLQVIGKSFNRYHATALHSIGIVERELKSNHGFKKQVEYLCQKLEEGRY